MVTDENVWESIWVTMRFGFWTITIEMFLGVSLALLLEKPIRGASLFRTIFILPLMVSPVVVGLIWRYLFDARVGWINYYLGAWFGIEPKEGQFENRIKWYRGKRKLILLDAEEETGAE